MGKKEFEDLLGATPVDDIDNSAFAQAIKRARERTHVEDTSKTITRQKPSPAMVRKPIADYQRKASEEEAARIAQEEVKKEQEELLVRAEDAGVKWSRWIEHGVRDGRELAEAVGSWRPIYRALSSRDQESRTRVLYKLAVGMNPLDVMDNKAKMAYLRGLRGTPEIQDFADMRLSPQAVFFVVSFEALSNMDRSDRRGLHTFMREHLAIQSRDIHAEEIVSRWIGQRRSR